jgi:acetyltransferase
VDYLRAHKIPEYRFPERAVRALAALHRYAAIQSRDEAVSHFHASEDMQQMVSSILSGDEKSSGFIPAKDVEKILSCYQIPTLSLDLAATEEEAVRVADASGYPVVMKIASEKISHKTDVGGVLLNLQSAEDVRQAFHRLNALVQENDVRSEIDGVFIQKMISSGQEVIVGAVRDPVFGPLLMFGSGGVEVEGLKDVQFATIPPANFEIEFLLERTWAGKKLRGFRNYQPADMDALKDIFIKFSQLMIDFPEINEVEVNPVIVLEEGNGAFAVDARILL